MKWSDFEQAERWKVAWGVAWRVYLVLFLFGLAAALLNDGTWL